MLTDDEFIEVWKRHLSATAVAVETGITERGVHKRRRRIEERRKMILPSAGLAVDRKLDTVIAIQDSRRDVNRIEIENGIIIIGSDAHYSPGVIPTAHQAMVEVIKELGKQVKVVVLNGDILDGGSISRHARIRWKKPPSVKDELDAVIARTEEIRAAVVKGTKLMRTYGNHCARFESRLSAQVPEFEGVGGFLLKDHLPHWMDSDRIDVNDDMVIIHDWHSGVHSGWNDVLKGGCHTVTGHTHELGCKAHRGFKKTHYGIKTGMLADNDQQEFDYRLGKPGLNWQSGFAVLSWSDGMMLFPEFCVVREDGSAYFRGKKVS